MRRPATRRGTCARCGAPVRAGRRGPVPRRCVRCRLRPVHPDRAAGQTRCTRCGGAIPVLGRRGPLPTRCSWCRAGTVRLEDLRPEDFPVPLPDPQEAS